MSSVVIDTHTLIWYLEQSPKISRTAIDILDQATRDDFPIFIASISLVELVYLIEKKRLGAFSLERLLSELATPESPFSIVPLILEVVQSLQRIPKIQVPDMPDRIIAETAHSLNIPLITCDHKILACPAIQTIW